MFERTVGDGRFSSAQPRGVGGIPQYAEASVAGSGQSFLLKAWSDISVRYAWEGL